MSSLEAPLPMYVLQDDILLIDFFPSMHLAFKLFFLLAVDEIT